MILDKLVGMRFNNENSILNYVIDLTFSLFFVILIKNGNFSSYVTLNIGSDVAYNTCITS